MYQKFYVEDHLKFAFMDELISSAQERYTLMQYTGLKDKNGVEIYEGDLVEIPFSDGPQLYEVYFHHGLVGYRLRNKRDEYRNFNLIQSMRVIGNIHQNPELLEGKI